MADGFVFLDTDGLCDDEIRLELADKRPADPARGLLPVYQFFICSAITGERMGRADLRIGYSERLYYGGNIGYGVYGPFRGHRYAAKACRLLFGLAKRHGMRHVYITCGPDNLPSRKTCEILGMTLVETVLLPRDSDMYIRGEREKCVYRMEL